MPVRRMPTAVFQRQHRHFVLHEVVFRQFHRAVEDRDDMLCFKRLRLRIRSVTLEANAVRFLCSQQMLVLAAMGFMANRATFPERGLVQVRLLELIGLIRVAS